MSQFDELLAELSAVSDEQTTLAKALPAEDGEDDKVIQAAAAEGDDANPEDNEDEPDGDEGQDDKPMAKSVTATVDGEEVEAIDATELLKSLDARIGSQEEVLAKALASTVSTIKAQGDMIKSMQAQISKLAGQGKGRKTVLTVAEKPVAGDQPMAKSQQQEGFTPQEFMAKANAAFNAGKLSGIELTTADVSIRSGVPVPAGIIAKALS